MAVRVVEAMCPVAGSRSRGSRVRSRWMWPAGATPRLRGVSWHSSSVRRLRRGVPWRERQVAAWGSAERRALVGVHLRCAGEGRYEALLSEAGFEEVAVEVTYAYPP